jgi:V/A-type H+/Na+-transporting ATPase subunit I
LAVEKLELLNLVAEKGEMDRFLRRLALMENIHLVNAMTEVDPEKFKFLADEESKEKVLEACTVKSFKPEFAFKDVNDRLSFIMRTCSIGMDVNKNVALEDYDFSETSVRVNEMYKTVKKLHDDLLDLSEEEKLLDEFKFLKYLDDVDVDFKQLNNLENFRARIGSLTSDNRKKLALNYENVSATVMHIGEVGGEEVILVVYPVAYTVDTDKLLKSVYFRDIELLESYLDYPEKMRKTIEDRLISLRVQKAEVQGEIDVFKAENEGFIKTSYSKLIVEKTVAHMKNTIAETKNFFYIAGWLPSSDKKKLETTLSGLNYEVISVYKKVEETAKENQPPTKLNNSKFARPFELLVDLYGVPNYFEIDPTPLLSIVYLIFFGAMFGDLGQGFVLVLAGFFASIKMGMVKPGGLLKRMGVASMIFGFLYDSFFGKEYIISSLVNGTPIPAHGAEPIEGWFQFIRPLEKTNEVLIAAVSFGLVMLLIAYVYSIINKLRMKQYMEAYLGKSGVNGLMLFISFLLTIGTAAGLVPIPSAPFIILLIATTVILLLREPIYNLATSHRPLHHEPPADYYVENGFELMETFIGMTSNAVSFVRIGAFAMNHAGLFLAFAAVTAMIGGGATDIIMTAFGNVFVLTLEVLIVFIQGMRLSYYEMFSKFFVGEGLPWNNVEIKNYDVR